LANWFSAMRRAVETHLPNTVKLNPFSTEGLIFLLTTGMLGRLMVGTTRTVADAPPLNPNDDQSPQQKTNIQLERVFMEFVGVPINFLVLKFCEDLGEYASVGVDRGLLPNLGKLLGKNDWGNTINPGHWLNKLEGLSEAEKETVARGLVYTFNPAYRQSVVALKKKHLAKHSTAPLSFSNEMPCFENLDKLSFADCQKLLLDDWHALSKTFNNKAKLSTLMEGLEKLSATATHGALSPDSFKSTAAYGFLEKQFATNNIKTNLFLLGAGTIGSTLFSGVIWQYLNDSFIRKKLVPLVGPTVTSLYYGKNYQKEWDAQQALLFPDDNATTKPAFSLLEGNPSSGLKPCYSYSKQALASSFSPSYFYSNSVLNFKP